ncbi:MAG: sodA [Patescibacteria group bacterium]|jgi:Fe-Mn family superoxide dismutase|nr:sodA [Patescibacteria group bacterium]
MAHEVVSPNPGELKGISARTNEIHHGKLYAGYVAKRNEIEGKMGETDLTAANQIYSAWRGLKEGETFAANGMILHEVFFDILGGEGNPEGTSIKEAIVERWGTWERFIEEFTATGMAARGWAILAFDTFDKQLHIYAADAQNQGAVWGSMPLLPCDVYEHAYVIDFGSDRKAYIAAFLENVKWERVEERYKKVAA